MTPRTDLRADLIRYFDNAFPRIQQDRWPFTIVDLADGIMATIDRYFPEFAPSACGDLRDDEITEMRRTIREATEAMAAALPVISAIRAWRDTPRVATKKEPLAVLNQRLELAILDALNDFDELAGYPEPVEYARLKVSASTSKPQTATSAEGAESR
jgi:hypothetical protein